jgi:hypothetical protein
MKRIATAVIAGAVLLALSGCANEYPAYASNTYPPSIDDDYLRDRDLYLRDQPGHYDSYGGYHPYF